MCKIIRSLLGRQGQGGQGNLKEGREWTGDKEEWKWAKGACLGKVAWGSWSIRLDRMWWGLAHRREPVIEKLPEHCHTAQWNSGSWCHFCRLHTDLVPNGCPLSVGVRTSMEKWPYFQLERSNTLYTYLLIRSCLVLTSTLSGSSVVTAVRGLSFSSATN